MLIDCDTCTARGTGCADCVVTVLLGAPPGWQSTDPVVVPMTGRARAVEETLRLPDALRLTVGTEEANRHVVETLAAFMKKGASGA